MITVWWAIAFAVISAQATMQTRIALGHNNADYGWPFVSSDNFKVAAAILLWVFAAFCLIALVVTL